MCGIDVNGHSTITNLSWPYAEGISIEFNPLYKNKTVRNISIHRHGALTIGLALTIRATMHVGLTTVWRHG
eukprot:6465682-Amphidinium_carterae.2